MTSNRMAKRRRVIALGRRYRAVVLGILLGLNAIIPGTAWADTGPWSPAVEISGGKAGWFPDVAADDSGNVYVVWNGGYDDRPLWGEPTNAEATIDGASSSSPVRPAQQVGALYFTRWDGHHWTKPNDIALASWTVALRSSLAVDSAGWLHLTRLGIDLSNERSADARQLIGAQDVWYTSAKGAEADVIRSWQSPTRITQSTQGYYSDIAIDTRGVIHIIWTESQRGTWGLYYTHSTDGGRTWSPRVPLDEDNPVSWLRPQLKVDTSGRVHIVWGVLDSQSHYGHIIAMAYAISQDGGATWSKTVFPGNHDPEPYTTAASQEFQSNQAALGPQQPAVGVDGQGTILLVYREPVGNSIVYRTSRDGISWSAPTSLPDIRAGVPRPFDVYSTATDSAGHVHLLMVGYANGSTTMSLLHSEWDGKHWLPLQVIASSPPYPEYPRLAIGEGNRLHVVWFDGDRSTIDRTPIDVSYSTALTNAPRVSPQATAMGAPSRPTATPAVARGQSLASASVRSTSAAPPPLPAAARIDQSPPWLSALQQSKDYPLALALIALAPVLAGVLLVRIGARLAGR